MEKKNIKPKNNKKKKGFTLIELLAVIVILGLLIAIAIPSITKYITQSRKKTVVSSIDGYISSAVNSVNDQDYKFTTPNTIYAVPIECIAIEKGGTNPFGEWMQANKDYWAYVLVQYDSTNFSYTYGFTFKDSAGYGMYPTVQSEINPKSKTQIQTGLDLKRPESGSYSNIASKENWVGFNISDDTKVIVLEAESKGKTGNGENTCTLCQEGSNYKQAEQEKAERKPTLTNLILKHNTVVAANPTLTTTSSEAMDTSGLYRSTDTNSGNPTYYFRGNVTNNNVNFAGLEWKIIRINEDGTVRLKLNDSAGNYSTRFVKQIYYLTFENMYYSKSDLKINVDNWYQTNIGNVEEYDNYVAKGEFCEQAKVKVDDDYTGGKESMAVYSSYKPTFKCSTDENGYGELELKAGLITYDELIYAGAYYNKSVGNDWFLYYKPDSTYEIWTMSPGGQIGQGISVWTYSYSRASSTLTSSYHVVHPVINLKADVLATGTGTIEDPYVIQTN